MKKPTVIFSIALLALLNGWQTSGWQSLFNGKDIAGFVQLHGQAQYMMENGEMVGISTPDTREIYQANFIPNTLTEKEVSDGWKLLFDGTTTEGWRGAHKESFPESGWVIENG